MRRRCRRARRHRCRRARPHRCRRATSRGRSGPSGRPLTPGRVCPSSRPLLPQMPPTCLATFCRRSAPRTTHTHTCCHGMPHTGGHLACWPHTCWACTTGSSSHRATHAWDCTARVPRDTPVLAPRASPVSVPRAPTVMAPHAWPARGDCACITRACAETHDSSRTTRPPSPDPSFPLYRRLGLHHTPVV